MKPGSVGRFPRGICLLFALLQAPSQSAAQPARAACGPSPTVPCCAIAAAPAYLGSYLPDGSFRPNSPSHRANPSLTQAADRSGSQVRPREVPDFVDLHPMERVVENYQPPARATKSVRRRVFFSDVRDSLLTLVYGREQILVTPQHMAVDSQRRVIVSDPGIGAVHVLDGNKSFRIAAGAGHRLYKPMAIAVDADDNIYVTDPERGVIVLFDRDGTFIRDIGRLGNETLFHQPTSIAIDQQNGRLYLSDTSRNVIFVLDMQGRVLERVGAGRAGRMGRYSANSSPLDLDHPTEIALGGNTLAVLDSDGSRIRILNLHWDTLAEINVRVKDGSGIGNRVSLAMDSSGRLYVTNVGSSVRVYDSGGRQIDADLTKASGERSFPSGLCVDSGNRVYIADRSLRQIEVFQMPPAAPEVAANAH